MMLLVKSEDPPQNAVMQKLKSVNLRTEIVAGITTFFTMAYIVIVNPTILSTPGTGMPFSGVLAATVLICFLMTLLMGIYADLPFAVAPGMGINAFFTYTVILGQKVPWQVALGIVFWAGVLFVITSLASIRLAIAKAIPQGIRSAAAAGIGIFLTFIGLKNAGFLTAHPATFITVGTFDHKTVLALVGLGLCLWLMHRKNPLAFLIGIFSVTAVGWLLGYEKAPPELFSKPDFSGVFLKLDILGALKLSLLPTIIAIFFTDLFDSISTFVGVSQATGLIEKGQPKNLKEGLLVDALATMGAGLAGTSAGTAYIESAAGIEAGGRTGWTSVVTAFCFLPCLFLAPLAGMVPAYATAPVLILVGALMFKSIGQISLTKIEDAFPAFLTVVLIPLTFSITQGILWGFISHVFLYVMTGRRKEIHPLMYPIALISIGLVALEQLR